MESVHPYDLSVLYHLDEFEMLTTILSLISTPNELITEVNDFKSAGYDTEFINLAVRQLPPEQQQQIKQMWGTM